MKKTLKIGEPSELEKLFRIELRKIKPKIKLRKRRLKKRRKFYSVTFWERGRLVKERFPSKVEAQKFARRLRKSIKVELE